ncbi:formate--tetrahydrofolate ligase [Propionibacterium australiense]|uniref:Formate--tetrahydrofolate ligase n=1 Tax=Propionibacterium australiense TaxID=119981 RepID=A0A383S3T6_9ACTN|nr:formate--tetrahydrofolate ligase [Propionibacterium australiense]RLP12008.1 formate--tetrahydrofolate ligase [Propionibacterium australiense]RLP12645.1 formate--tetrahydrofolate ligase [Propionibacterium australiense]SYZ32523.1 formate-tetrahydrofolate ligase [Propionibacterium australiense]VEH91726.1 Formate--tetrahydrofolate ligase [Propionibacterium australiense]
MKTDVQIAQETALEPIAAIAQSLGIDETEYEPYGHDKAKLSLGLLDRLAGRPDGKLVLVTAINPTPAGEGKTTTNVGLAMALNRTGRKAITTLREPSMGPCFGVKGGAAGGGYAQVLPMEDINLHFTGDMHAIGAAHNLLAALIDNSIHQGNPLNIDPQRVELRRVVDMNDRALRQIVVGLGRRVDGVPRQSGYDITVASEIMAVLCLATGFDDLKARLGRIIPAYTYDQEPVTVERLGATGAMALLLKDAIKPNLVQTTENTPALIHGGPFANIAHGCNSVLATRMGLKLADYTITEAGFGADLGAEKFLDIVCPSAGFAPDAVVLVATIRALKFNGGVAKQDLDAENLTALEEGMANLEQHLDNIAKYGVPVVVALNAFPADTAAETALVRERCAELGVRAVTSTVFADGGAGGVELAEAVAELCEQPSEFAPIYDSESSLRGKIEIIAREIYRADGVEYAPEARRQLERLSAQGFDDLPVCIAKTQYSFSDDAALLGAPRGFTISLRELSVRAGAGFVVGLAGDIMTMPGLPKRPAALGMDIDPDGRITGLS